MNKKLADLILCKDLSKLFLIAVYTIGMIFCVTGCSNGENNFDNVSTSDNKMKESQVINEQDTNYQKEPTNVKVSELFTKDELRIWYRILDDTISYDGKVYEVFICKDGDITSYEWCNTPLDSCPRLEEFDGMEDKEIITYIEKTLKKSPNEESIQFLYTRDDSGNKIATETLKFEHSSRKFFDIGRMLKPVTVLSNQFFGITTDEGGMSLITKYNFEKDTNIILNEIGDERVVEF